MKNIIKKIFSRYSEVSVVEQDTDENTISEIVEPPQHTKLQKISFKLILIMIFLLPIFFIPLAWTDLLFDKQLLFFSVILLSFLAWLIARLKSGSYDLPISPILYTGAFVLVATLLSALFSRHVSLSFFGQGNEVFTFISLAIGFLAVFIIPIYFNTKERIFSVYTALFIAFAILTILEMLKLIFGNDLPLGMLKEITANTVGKWYDFGIFIGLILLLSLISLEFFAGAGRSIKVISYVSLFASLILLVFINFGMMWLLISLFSVVLFVYLFSFSKNKNTNDYDDDSSDDENIKNKKKFPVATTIVAVVSLFFTIIGGNLSNTLASKIGIAELDVRPSLSATFSVARQSMAKDPLFGVGPNLFNSEWLMHKDILVNESVFWQTDFNYGIGLIPTFMINTGIVGTLAWVLFIISFIYLGFRSLFLSPGDKLIRFLVISSFFGSLLLWISTIVYVPSNVIFYLTFIFTGLFLSTLFISGALKMRYGSYVNSSKKNFISVLIIIILIIVSLSAEYYILKHYLANKYFRQAFIAANIRGNIDEAEAKLLKAVSVSDNDIYHRALSDVGIIRLSNLVSNTNQNISEDALRASFQNILSGTLNHADLALKIDSSNYLNWINKGKIFEVIVPLKVQGAYEQAKANYEESVKYYPNNPAIYLILARLESTKGDNVKAKEYISMALGKKRNYIDAIFLLAQIETNEGNIKGAINSVQSAATLSPNDPTIFFRLGLLYFNNKEYKNAVDALSQAVNLNPIYANARYFLGLSYEKIGKDKEAIVQFEELQKTNPDNQEVILILNNLKAGRSPFSNAKSPIDDKPEKRVKPPIKEE